MHLDSRVNYPEYADTLTVYREDAELRSTEEGSWAQLAWPAADLKERRRGETT